MSPAVVEQYRDGRTLASFERHVARRVTSDATGLGANEEALLSLLRSWRVREARRT